MLKEVFTFDKCNGNLSDRETMRDFIRDAYTYNRGISWGILMKTEEGGIHFHERIDQPCYGEMRKYSMTAPVYDYDEDEYIDPVPLHSDCTQPDDERPDDLEHPFPDGTPMAVCALLKNSFVPNWNEKEGFYDEGKKWFREYTEFMFGSDSPWLQQVDTRSVELIYEDEMPIGVIFYDTDLDPTVLVNLLNCHKIMSWKMFKVCRENGGSLLSSTYFAMTLQYNGMVNHSFGYYYPAKLDVSRFCNGQPRDFTGGTLENRFDYSRQELHSIFATDEDGDEPGLNPHEFGRGWDEKPDYPALVKKFLGLWDAEVFRTLKVKDMDEVAFA